MRIGSRQIGWDSEPYIIAEIGVNHDGDVARALDMIDAASAASADAIKIQYFEAARLLSRAAQLATYQQDAGEANPFEMLRRLELPIDAMARMIDRAHARKVHAIVTLFSVEHVSECGSLPWDAIKIASPDVVNTPLLDETAELGRAMIVSTGAAERREVTATLRRYGDAALHCVSAYPTPDEKAQLAGIAALRRLVELIGRPVVEVGYSDHTTSVETGALAVAAGAVILEKHLTHDRAAAGPDHAASLDPSQFSDFALRARHAWRMRGPREVIVQAIERDVRMNSRQSLVALRTIESGQAISRSDLTIKRPGTGIAPARLESIVGRTVRRRIEADTPLHDDDLTPTEVI